MSRVSSETLATSARALFALMQLPGIGARTAIEVARRGRMLIEAVDATLREPKGVVTSAGLASLRNADLLSEALVEADGMLWRSEQLGVRALGLFDDEYPPLLRLLSDAPAILYVKGKMTMGVGARRAVACVGTREPSEFGVRAAQSVTRSLAQAGFSIVSGLAIGVDTLAHRAALDAEGRTVAVLANGLDTVYPKNNARLAAEIVERGGALLSEWPVGTPVLPRNLVQRDRLQSGLSLGTVVFQTDIKGGSMHTVRFTLTQRRLLFAPVPTGIHAEEPKSRGVLALTLGSGRELAQRLDLPNGDAYRALLESLSGPPAFPVRRAEETAEVVARLEGAVVTEAGQEQLRLTLG